MFVRAPAQLFHQIGQVSHNVLVGPLSRRECHTEAKHLEIRHGLGVLFRGLLNQVLKEEICLRKKETPQKEEVTYLEGRNGDTNDLLLDARLDGFNQKANDCVFPE